MTPGAKFRQALRDEKPLQIPGAINAYHATLAKASGFKAIYLSGGGVAAGSLGPHAPGKERVAKEEMADRIKAAVDARTDPGFFVMARTDALASEGLDRAVERA